MGLPSGIWSHHFMANRWVNNGNSERLYFGGSKTTSDGDCCHEIKRCVLLGRKAMINLDIILKNRGITLPTKVHLVKVLVFPVVINRCESWTIKKDEHQRTDAFELWCWRRLFERISWAARRSNQWVLKEVLNIHWKVWCWSWSSNTLATRCQELTHWKTSWCWERLRQEEKGSADDEMVGWHLWLDGHKFDWAPGVGGKQGSLACCSP